MAEFRLVLAASVRARLAQRPAARNAVMRWRARSLAETDVYLAAYPKSGSTWLRFLIAQMMGADPDFESIAALVPPLGWHNGPDTLRMPTGGRIVKVHDPAPHLVATAPRRAIVLVRDPRDVAISFYYHKGGTDEPLSAFVSRFLDGDVSNYGTWSEHVLSWLDWPGPRLIMSYERLLRDGATELVRVVDFLGLDLGQTALGRIEAACRPERMRQKETTTETVASSGKRVGPTTGFVRTARTGQWRDKLPEYLQRRFAREAGEALHRLHYPLA
jgi:hypothetical protein